MVAILPCEEPCLDCAGLAEHEDPGFGRYTPLGVRLTLQYIDIGEARHILERHAES